MKKSTPVQAHYPDEVAVCYGCGRNNAEGMHIQSYWQEDGECVSRHTPDEKYTAFPGYIYGGVLASLIDCHSMATAIAGIYAKEDREIGSAPEVTTVTGNLNVSYLKPTPMGVELEIRARVKEILGRKVTVESTIYANGEACVRGEVVAIRVESRLLVGK